MKKIVLLVILSLMISDCYSAERPSRSIPQELQQYPLLLPILDYTINEPTQEDIARFLEKYPAGVTYQNVFSNRQKAALCGTYALQNLLWYRASIGNNPDLALQQRIFKAIFEEKSAIMKLDFIEAAPLDYIAESLLPNNYFLVSVIKRDDGTEYFAIRNPQGINNIINTENFVDYVQKVVKVQGPTITSVLLNTGGHWIALTIVSNENKRVYLVANSLAGGQNYISQFVENLIKEIENNTPVYYFIENFDPQYEIISNTSRDENERNTWKTFISSAQFLKDFKKNIEDNFVNNCDVYVIENIEYEGAFIDFATYNCVIKYLLCYKIIVPCVEKEIDTIIASVQTQSGNGFSTENVKKYWNQERLNADLQEKFITLADEICMSYPVVLKNNALETIKTYVVLPSSFMQRLSNRFVKVFLDVADFFQ